MVLQFESSFSLSFSNVLFLLGASSAYWKSANLLGKHSVFRAEKSLFCSPSQQFGRRVQAGFQNFNSDTLFDYSFL